MITLEELKNNYILPMLAKTPYSFQIFTDTGDYEKAQRIKNRVIPYINGLLSLTSSEVVRIGSLPAIALVTALKFMVPCGENNENNEFPDITSLRDALTNVFSQNNEITLESDGIIYTGGVSYSLPQSGIRSQRTLVGDSFTFICNISFAFLPDAVNSTTVSVTVDGEVLNVTNFSFTRRPTLTADLYAKSAIGEAATYAENTAFAVDLEIPVSGKSAFSMAVSKHILGLTDSNVTHTVALNFGGLAIRTLTMLLGECSVSGGGVENTVYRIALIPYATPEILGG